MRKILLGVIAAALAVAGACAYHETTREPTHFELACQIAEERYENACDGLDTPMVIETLLLEYIGAYGVYVRGETWVFVMPQDMIDMIAILGLKEPPAKKWVIVHEMIHYILYNLYPLLTRCESETLARAMTAEISGIPEDPDWRAAYGCTKA